MKKDDLNDRTSSIASNIKLIARFNFEKLNSLLIGIIDRD